MEDSFKNRETQAEAKFAHDEELKFKIAAHRNKLFAAWAADQLGDEAPPDYAESLLEFAFGRAQSDLIAKVMTDLHCHGITLADIKIHKAFDQCGEQAQLEVMNDITPTAGDA